MRAWTRSAPLALLLIFGQACPAPPEDTGAPPADLDGDGFDASQDCDDQDPAVHPGATEVCDGVDDDCDGLTDEDMPDADGDGVCDGIDPEECDGLDNDGDGLVDEDFGDSDGDGTPDCLDEELCDGLDNDGDGLVDEDTPDTDGDGFCDGLDHEACDGLDNDGDGLTDEDFSDTDADGIADCMDREECDGLDNDGDGLTDEGFPDTDHDGTADCLDAEDCDGLDNDGDGLVDEDFGDSDADGTADCLDEEECDGLDNDGDGLVDEGYPDADGDGTADCVDVEACDGLDNDGDGLVDEDFGDSDGDGTADCLDTEGCDGLDNDGDGFVDEGFLDTDGDGTADCVDVETCDGLDNDGDGLVDEGFADTDGDGTVDCLDAEDCDGLDNDGDGLVDEDFGDADGDGTADCLDVEGCDGVDNDGDGLVDEGFADTDLDGTADCVDAEECDGLDNDGDGLVDEVIGDDVDGDGYTPCDGDCDDADPDAWPGNPEDRDLVDDDCDGLVDEDFLAAGDVLVSEIHYDPVAVSDGAGEYLELFNASAEDLDLVGWTLTDLDGDAITIEDSLVLAAGDYAVLGCNPYTAANGGVSEDYTYSRASRLVLDNGPDELILAAGSLVLDAVAWDITGAWSYSAGHAQGLDPDLLDATSNDDGGAWCAATSLIVAGGDYGTPGRENDLCPQFDHDGDGYSGDDGDCDDESPSVYPGAPEIDPGVDNDCDGVIGNTLPVAIAEVLDTGTISTCEELLLDGSGSWDPDGDPILSWSWSLDAAPAASGLATADIDAPHDASPVFVPDVEGTYTFGLMVSDGLDSSVPVSVDAEVVWRGYNGAPTAAAGADFSYSGSTTCTVTAYGTTTCPPCATVIFALDGTASSDPDGDALAVTWTVLSGGSYGGVTDDASLATSLVVSGVPATYGSTSTVTVELELTVGDCEGEEDSDTVRIGYACTGI
ncbi:MAG: MopE-related protein [Pseudomonadota bacterium]